MNPLWDIVLSYKSNDPMKYDLPSMVTGKFLNITGEFDHGSHIGITINIPYLDFGQ